MEKQQCSFSVSKNKIDIFKAIFVVRNSDENFFVASRMYPSQFHDKHLAESCVAFLPPNIPTQMSLHQNRAPSHLTDQFCLKIPIKLQKSHVLMFVYYGYYELVRSTLR